MCEIIFSNQLSCKSGMAVEEDDISFNINSRYFLEQNSRTVMVTLAFSSLGPTHFSATEIPCI